MMFNSKKIYYREVFVLVIRMVTVYLTIAFAAKKGGSFIN